MSVRKHHQQGHLTVVPTADKHRDQICDSSGYAMFSTGEDGDIHVVAHRMLDAGSNELGRQLLGAWLDSHTGSGSDWAHLQWHMAIFDLSLGNWNAALARFQNQILPVVTSSFDALTDAPALLWRLSLAAGAPVVLPWQPVRLRALASMKTPRSAFVEIHNLLALAGARDIGNLQQWLQQRRLSTYSRSEAVVFRIAIALQSFVAGSYEIAATTFESIVPYVAEIGGSRAQNDLFGQLQKSAHRLAHASDSLTLEQKVA
jgi:hypothetical protein